MKSRVTITLNPLIHQRAKRQAHARKTSVSGLIETLLESVEVPVTTSVVDRMIGSAALRSPAVGSDPLHDALATKHLRQ